MRSYFHVPIRLHPILLFLILFVSSFPGRVWSASHSTVTHTQQICPFEIVVAASGLTVNLSLTSISPVAPPDAVKWTLASGQVLGFGPQLTHSFPAAGTFEICAQYEFVNQVCNVCTTITIGSGGCIDTSLIDLSIACPAVFDPVCGCDGNTYGNSCEALNHHGVTSWIPGACTGGNPCFGLIAGFSQTPAGGTPLSVQFHDQSAIPGGQIVAWSWDFDDGTTSSEQHPLHTFAQPGSYTVCLKVTAIASTGGATCTATYCQQVQVTNNCQDKCVFYVDYQLSGLGLHAYLTPEVIDALQPDSVIWSIDNQVVSTDLELQFNFQQPGTFFVCAQYIAADGTSCEACAVVRINDGCFDPGLIELNVQCPAIYEPVCGCDGNTYENACVAKFHNGISSWTPGVCPDLCQDTSLVDPLVLCTAIYDPVCGCNGVTYPNDCVAAFANGITSWTKGPCCALICDSVQVKFTTTTSNTDSLLVFFQNISMVPGGSTPEWYWSFGDGSVSTESNPDHHYTVPGEYTVCLKLKVTFPDASVCQREFCQVIKVGGSCDDACHFSIRVNIDGAKLHAWLLPDPVDPPAPAEVKWTVNGITEISGPHYFHSFPEPGRYTVCATYTGLTGDECTTCKVMEITALCTDSTLINPQLACPAVFIPVCGCDGVTYGNACEALNHHGVTSWVPGECGSICNDLQVDFEGFNSGGSLTVWTFTGQVFFPNLNGVTWHWDFGNGATSNEQQPTINFLQSGEYVVCLTVTAPTPNGGSCTNTICKVIKVPEVLCFDPLQIDTTVACPTIYDPVCGCDGITYANKCEAEFFHGLTAWTPGVCPNSCENPGWIDTNVFCPQVYDPVCGCDGHTYSNSCEAENYHGITSWEKGPCCITKACKAFFAFEILPDNTVKLSDLSVNAESWSLDFGDGTIHPGYFSGLTHTYASPGIYQICLEISNFAGSCTDKYCVTVDFSASGVQQPGNLVRMVIAPNPATQFTRVTVDGALPANVLLWDIYGQQLWSANAPGQQFEVPLKSVPGGVYLLQVQTNKGAVTRRLVVAN